MHVLELAKELKLTPEQRQLVKAAFDRMKAKAKELGDAYVKAERAVDQAFKSGTADAAEVAARVAEANRLLGEVRLSHLLRARRDHAAADARAARPLCGAARLRRRHGARAQAQALRTERLAGDFS